MISLTNVTFAYRNGPPVLDGLSFHIARGEMAALLGHNGAGKTTLLKHLNGLLRPSGGRVVVDGLDTARAGVSRMARKIGFLFQNPDHQIFLPTVAREIAYGPSNLGIRGGELRERVAAAAQQTGLTEFLDRPPQSLGRGLRQRVALASVLAMRPPVLVLDEPTTGQDEAEAECIMSAVRRFHAEGATVVLVTHDMELAAAHARRILVLDRGRLLLDGPPEDVFAEESLLTGAGLKPPVSYALRALGLPADEAAREAV